MRVGIDMVDIENIGDMGCLRLMGKQFADDIKGRWRGSKETTTVCMVGCQQRYGAWLSVHCLYQERRDVSSYGPVLHSQFTVLGLVLGVLG